MASCRLVMVALLAATASGLAGCGEPRVPRLTADQICRIGVYRLSDGRWLDLAPSEKGDLRWRTSDGRVGRLHADDAWRGTVGWTDHGDKTVVDPGACGQGRVSFRDPGESALTGTKVFLSVTDTTFTGDGGTKLAGRLVMPAGNGKVPVIVQVHGSEKASAVVYNFHQRLFPAQGIGVFVYDKRGTGTSAGKYTQDFEVLARDAAAAAREVRRLAAPRISRLGFEGGSQGGWVAPLAATKVPVDFVVVGYGLADSPLAENRDEALQDVARFGPEAQAKARKAIAASEVVMTSRFKGGWEGLAAARARYGKEPWFKAMKGEFTGDFYKYPAWGLKIAGPHFDVGTPWGYDPMPVLRRQKAPLLWILAGSDTSAPVPETRRRLMRVAAEQAPITVMEFPRTEHGILEFEENAAGERIETGYADGYFRAVVDWARDGALKPPYGDAFLLNGVEAGAPDADGVDPS